MATDALEFARREATEDVRQSLSWLTGAGFSLRSFQGGSGESFGNVLLEFERGRTAVRVVRDRGQWMLDVAPDREFIWLEVLLTAMSDGVADPGPERAFTDPLPEQLPEGVSWRRTLPQVVAWLESGDRSSAVAASERSWREAMRVRFPSWYQRP